MENYLGANHIKQSKIKSSGIITYILLIESSDSKYQKQEWKEKKKKEKEHRNVKEFQYSRDEDEKYSKEKVYSEII